MKLKGRSFPFWAVKLAKDKYRWEVLRFVRKENTRYFYDTAIKIFGYSSGPDNWWATVSSRAARFSKYYEDTVYNMKEVSFLQSRAKQLFISKLFEAFENG